MNFNLFFLVVIWDTNCFTKKSSNDFITSLSLLHSTPSRDDDASIALREYNNHFSEGSGYFFNDYDDAQDQLKSNFL